MGYNSRAMHPKQFYQHCPSCGSEQFVAGTSNTIHCGECDFTWYYNAAAAADVIVENSLGEILMTRRAREPMAGTLDFPGGFVNENESAELAVCREAKEETGIDIDPATLRYLASFPNQYVFGGVTYFALDLVFVAQVGDVSRSIARDDVASATFMALKEIAPEDIGLESTRQAFRHYRQTLHELPRPSLRMPVKRF